MGRPPLFGGAGQSRRSLPVVDNAGVVTAAEPRFRFDAREWSGAFADLGVLVPIAVALIVVNGLSPTAVLLPAGLLYITSGLIYRVPIPVQPLKAFGAIAIAQGLGPQVIAAGALLMGAIFVILGATGAVDRAARLVPRPIIRGVQLSVGLLFAKLAFDLVANTPAAFVDRAFGTGWLVTAAVAAAVVLLVARRHPVALVLVLIALVLVAVRSPGPLVLGPAPMTPASPTGTDLITALLVLVIPQLPLTFANACLATADAAQAYFPQAAGRVSAGRLATSLGLANLLAGAVTGMPVCHGAGGLTAHRAFGARSGGAPIIIGVILVAVALGIGGSVGLLLTRFPVSILAALMAVAGALHIALLRDLAGRRAWVFALAVGVVGVWVNLAVAVLGGLILWWLAPGRTQSTSGFTSQ